MEDGIKLHWQVTYVKIAVHSLDQVVQALLLGQEIPALDVPGAVRDARDVAADVAGDDARGPADAAAQVQHAHALLQAGHPREHLLVLDTALGDGAARRLGRVVEPLAPGVLCQSRRTRTLSRPARGGMYAPSLLIQRRDEVVVVRGNLVVVLLALLALLLGRPADSSVVDAREVGIPVPVAQVPMQPVLGIAHGHMRRHGSSSCRNTSVDFLDFSSNSRSRTSNSKVREV